MTPAASASSQPERPDAFISYSRQDGEFVRGLVRALEARGKDVWVDLDDIPKSADWMAKVEQGLESAKAVVVVLSPALAASQICGQEIRHAIEHHKRLIPILRTDVEPEQLFPELNAPNWILAREQDDGDAAFEELVGALETDLAWLEVHARLVSRSVEWDRQNRDGSLLLRGDDLGTARRWLAARAEHREQPTELQVEYIGASRRSALIRRAVVGVAALAVVALGGFFLAQRDRTRDEQDRADLQERLAESRRLSADAVAQLDTDSRRALATALKAHAAAPTPEATQALRQALMQPRRQAILRVPGTSIWTARFADAKTVRARADDGRVVRFRLDGGDRAVLRRGPPPQTYTDPFGSRAANLFADPDIDTVRLATIRKGTVAVLDELGSGSTGNPLTAVLSPDGRRVLTVGYRAAADVWRVPARVISPPGDRRFLCAAAARSYTVTCDDRGRVLIWPSDAPRSRPTAFDESGSKSYFALDLDVDVSTDGTQIFVTSQREATVTVIESASGKIVATHATKGFRPPVLSANARRLYARSNIKDAAAGTLIAKLPVRDNDLVRPPALSSTGERVAIYLGDGVRVWDVARERVIAGPLHRPEGELEAYAISPSGRYVATVEARTVRIFKSDGGSEVERYRANERINGLEFSRNDAFVLTTGNMSARVTETATARHVASFAGHRGLLQSASFDFGARTVVTVGLDGLALRHDCPACAPPATLVKRARAALRVGP